MESSETTSTLSKRAMKRALKRDKWLREKPERRAAERAKRKARNTKEEDKNGDKLPYSRERKRLKQCSMASSKCNVHLVLDLSLSDQMSPKDLAKTAKQILRCYSTNRRLPQPTQMHLTSLNGLAKEELERHQGYENWDVFRHEQHYVECFGDRSKIVYLTSDSDNVLNEVKQGEVYVIGALVDHNSKKGLCHKLALEKGVRHARLPLSEHVELKTRHVLTVDQVFAIMGRVANGQAWKDTLMQCLPSRKGAVVKESEEQMGENKEEEELEENKEEDELEESKEVGELEEHKDLEVNNEETEVDEEDIESIGKEKVIEKEREEQEIVLNISSKALIEDSKGDT